MERIESYADYFPTMTALLRGNAALANAFLLRRTLVDRMFAMKKGEHKIATMMSHVLQLLACTDITHVIIIDTYIMKVMPEILNLPIIRQYDSNLLGMYQFWAENSKIFPYIRFYKRAEECYAIKQSVLQPLTIAAFAIGSFIQDSFKNYRGPMKESDLYITIVDIVKKYLSDRMASASVALAGSDRAVMANTERALLLELAVIKDSGDNSHVS